MAGCATTNQGQYETPLKEMGVLPEDKNNVEQIEIISEDQIPNIKPGERPPLDSEEAGLWMAMDQAEERLKTCGEIVNDEELSKYLKQIACRLSPEYCQDLRIYLLRVPHFNATMAPNGAMQIWTGLLVRVQNEAQLASIMGHEIGHYLRRHSLQRMQDIIQKTNTLAVASVATALVGFGLANPFLQMAAIGSITAFSRDNEREADGIGLALMSRAGYDPREAAKVWEQLLEENQASEDKDRSPLFLSTHPLPEERLTAIKSLGERIVARGEDFEIGQKPFHTRMGDKKMEYLSDELNLNEFKKTEKLIDILLQKETPNASLLYIKGDLYRRRGQDGDLQKAIDLYQKADQLGTPPPEMYRWMGIIQKKMGQYKKAVSSLNTYLRRCPTCSDKEMIQHMLKGLKNAQPQN